jgi:hypothetical protein
MENIPRAPREGPVRWLAALAVAVMCLPLSSVTCAKAWAPRHALADRSSAAVSVVRTRAAKIGHGHSAYLRSLTNLQCSEVPRQADQAVPNP